MSLIFVDYSEKAFAIVGETKPIKDTLKNLGGKWNAHLKCGAGWIFSKKNLEKVKASMTTEVNLVSIGAANEAANRVHAVTEAEYQAWLLEKERSDELS